MKIALITGVLGQDGSFLSEKLLNDGYEVIGIVRPTTEIVSGNFELIKLDLFSKESVEKLIRQKKPTHIFNFAGETNVFDPYGCPTKTSELNCTIPLNIIEGIFKVNRDIRFFQSSSSMMYGRSPYRVINEESEPFPLYPYVVTKLFIHNLIQEYREEFKMFLCSGILFNHDSERRGNNFFTQKIVLGIKDILEKKLTHIEVGDIDTYKDISYAGDFVDAMKLMMEQKFPEDYVLGKGEVISMREFIKKSFNYVGLDYENYIKINESFIKNKNKTIIVSDTSKIVQNLNWSATTSMDELIKIMIDNKIK